MDAPAVHSVAVKVDVFPDEFVPIMKALKFSLLSSEFRQFVVSDKDLHTIEYFLDAFSDVALNNAA